jgi:hypothetical protein
MAIGGGAAQLIGIWFQSLGAIASIVDPWHFSGVPGAATGSAMLAGAEDQLKVMLEYFDMDAARWTPKQFDLLQFKVGTQENPQSFTLEELRAILRNAALAVLRHRRQHGQPITGFILASNRPPGTAVQALQRMTADARKGLTAEPTMSVISAIPAPERLFRRESGRGKKAVAKRRTRRSRTAGSGSGLRTLGALATEIAAEMTDAEDFSPEDRVAACVTALAHFRFAFATPSGSTEVLWRWFRTWGLLSHEYEGVQVTPATLLRSCAAHWFHPTRCHWNR